MLIAQQRVAPRVAWFLLAAVFVSWLALGGRTASVSAQDAGKKAEEVAAAAEPAGGGTAEGAAEAGKPRKSYFRFLIEASGLIGLFILILSVYFVATISRLFWEFRMPVAVPPEIVGRSQDLLGQRDFKGVFAVVKDDDAIFSRLLSTGITELPNGLAEARDAMERVGESIRVEMEKRISVLAVLGTLGPMIGLVGTLMGMIKAFSEIAQGGAELNAQRIALAISMALVITLEGVSLSVPAIWFFSLFRNRVSVITTNAGVEADQFLRHFAHAARAKTPAGAPAAGAASTATMAGAKAAPRAE
jgi:biopolymer transport protein ExbB